MIKAVLFDYGGVLNPLGTVGSIEALFSKGLGVEVPLGSLNDIHNEFRAGRMSEEDFMRALHDRFPNRVSDFQTIHWDNPDLMVKNPKVYELAKRLREEGIITGIISNIYAPQARLLEAGGFYDGFDPIILSCDVGYAKPEHEIYDLALEALHLPAGEVLLIDDQDKCFPPAQKLGMKTLKAISEDQIVEDAQAALVASSR